MPLTVQDVATVETREALLAFLQTWFEFTAIYEGALQTALAFSPTFHAEEEDDGCGRS